jgi:hypothetical protein
MGSPPNAKWTSQCYERLVRLRERWAGRVATTLSCALQVEVNSESPERGSTERGLSPRYSASEKNRDTKAKNRGVCALKTSTTASSISDGLLFM